MGEHGHEDPRSFALRPYVFSYNLWSIQGKQSVNCSSAENQPLQYPQDSARDVGRESPHRYVRDRVSRFRALIGGQLEALYGRLAKRPSALLPSLRGVSLVLLRVC